MTKTEDRNTLKSLKIERTKHNPNEIIVLQDDNFDWNYDHFGVGHEASRFTRRD